MKINEDNLKLSVVVGDDYYVVKIDDIEGSGFSAGSTLKGATLQQATSRLAKHLFALWVEAATQDMETGEEDDL